MTHALYKTKEEIENWLNLYHIKNYELIEDKNYGYVINVNGNVDLSTYNIKEIKVKFNIIKDNFDISFNLLKSLKGCPEIVDKNFWCNDNKIKNLNYFPKIIKEEINISENKIKSLKGCPKITGDFWCQKNKLKNLQYCPKIINGTANFKFNQINTLEYFPKNITNECLLKNNNELGELENIKNFEELKKIHESIILNKKLEKEMSIDNSKNNVKIKL